MDVSGTKKAAALFIFLLSLLAPWSTMKVQAHNLGIHGLQGFDPPPTPELPDFHGPFVVKVQVRFDDVAGGEYQRLFDFGNGPEQDNVFVTQVSSTTDVMAGVYQDGVRKSLTIPNAIVQGELATWRFGVDASNRMWLEKNGSLLGQTTDGQIPKTVVRANKLLGDSNWAIFGGDTPLDGVILGFELRHVDEPVNWRTVLNFNNFPGQVMTSPFTASFYVRFDDYASSSYQRVFEFSTGSGAGVNHIQFATGPAGTNDLYLQIHNQGGVADTIVATGAITNREWAFYHVGVDSTGTMSIEKNGVALATGSAVSLPAGIFRRNLHFGQSNQSDGLLKGVVLGFRLDSHTAS